MNQERTDWLELLKRCQKEITTIDPESYYVKAYRDTELLYWCHIPGWIWEQHSLKPIQRCLDIGSAYGTLALYCKMLANADTYCWDWMDYYLNPTIIERHDLTLNVSNVELDTFPWNMEFDTIIFTEVLEHFNFHPLHTLKKISQLLTLDGKIYLSTPDAEHWGRTAYYSTYEEMPLPDKNVPLVDDHVYLFSKEELLNLIDAAGLRLVKFDYSPGVYYRHFNMVLEKKG